MFFLRGGRSSRPRGPGARASRVRHLFALFALFAVMGLLIPAATTNVTAAGAPSPALRVASSAHPAVAVASVGDNESLNLAWNGSQLSLQDAIVPLPSSSVGTRAYAVRLSTPTPRPDLRVEVTTNATLEWGYPDQLPGGAVALPPLGDWSWSVATGGHDDSANWTSSPSAGTLTQTVPWANATYFVNGTETLRVGVAADPAAPDGTRAPGGSVMLISPGGGQGAIPANDPDFGSLLAPLHPSLLRWGQYVTAPATWDNATGQPSFAVRSFSAIWNLSVAVGSQAYLTLPAGSWGDGNVLPAGMPLNLTLPVTFGGVTGYFPTEAAYAAYVGTFVNVTYANGWAIPYWNIGNEVPVKNGLNITGEYTRLYNLAAAIIHAKYPTAQVGSDVLTVASALPYFAANARGVDFLSFHYYPGNVTCPGGGATYCPPTDSNGYWRDATYWGPNRSMMGLRTVPPGLAQLQWHNLTGRWVPVLCSESNLALNPQGVGTDPRQQMLFGATWLASTLVDGAQQNLSAFIYFAFEGPPTTPTWPSGRFGGWSYGMTTEGTNDNDTRYAPYWALEMWDSAFPAGAVGLRVNSTDPGALRTYAARSNGNVSLLLVNRFDVPAVISVGLAPRNGSVVRVETLDQRSYLEAYNATLGATTLAASGTTVTNFAACSSLTVPIDGYGLSVVTYTPGSSSGSGGVPGGSNGTGSAGGVSPPQGSVDVRPIPPVRSGWKTEGTVAPVCSNASVAAPVGPGGPLGSFVLALSASTPWLLLAGVAAVVYLGWRSGGSATRRDPTQRAPTGIRAGVRPFS